ncbi:IS481 family transposase [Pseudonocardia tropica]|uniref:IS481 family transposase n=1 Tax=Pseudonocardia tropica TaxID=681289 RepID=A0ABV1K2P3_9PSEU
MAQLVVTAVLVEGRSKSEVARTYNVSRRWVITLVQRFLAEGEAGLEPRSRRPHTNPARTPQAVEDEIVELRKDLDRDGHDAGAATIAAHLQRRHGPEQVPAVSTIWRILSHRGFVTPQPHKRPKSSFQRFCADAPNERWQLDITHYRLADQTSVEILDSIDDHSRLAASCTCRRVFTAGDVDTAFTATTSHYGDPASLLSDNGAVFTGTPRRGGRVALEVTCSARGIRFDHSRPYHPQTCGKVERFHQTLKKWLDRQPRPATVGQLQKLLDQFRDYYNTVRPHRALDRRTPADAYAARPAAVPTGTPLDTGHYRVRHDRVDRAGVITLRHNSRLHHIGIGRGLAGVRVLALVSDLHVRIIHTDGSLVRELTLDPDRDYQPQTRP